MWNTSTLSIYSVVSVQRVVYGYTGWRCNRIDPKTRIYSNDNWRSSYLRSLRYFQVSVFSLTNVLHPVGIAPPELL